MSIVGAGSEGPGDVQRAEPLAPRPIVAWASVIFGPVGPITGARGANVPAAGAFQASSSSVGIEIGSLYPLRVNKL